MIGAFQERSVRNEKQIGCFRFVPNPLILILIKESRGFIDDNDSGRLLQAMLLGEIGLYHLSTCLNKNMCISVRFICRIFDLWVNGWCPRSCYLHQMDGRVDRVAVTMQGGHIRHLGRIFDDHGVAWYPIREASVLLLGRPKTAMYARCRHFRGLDTSREASELETRALKQAGIIKQRSTAPKLARHSALRAALKSFGVPTEQANCLHGRRVSQLVRFLNPICFTG